MKSSRAPRIQQWILDNFARRFPFVKKQPKESGLIHRIDVQTSGPLVVATNQVAFNSMRQQISQKDCFRKEYCALMHGKLPFHMRSGVMDYKLSTVQHEQRSGWRTFVDEKGGRRALTEYRATRVYRWKEYYYTLLRFRLITGLTH